MRQLFWITNSRGEAIGKLAASGSKSAFLTPSHLDGLGLSTDDLDFEIVPDGTKSAAVSLLDKTAFVSCYATSPFCPKASLKRQIDKLNKRGVAVLVGIELEFYLRDATPFETARLPGEHAYQVGEFLKHSEFFNGCLAAFAEAELPNVTMHSEGGPGQYEMSFGPIGPYEAAIFLVIAKLILEGIARRLGLVVDFSAKPIAGHFGNGLHLNFSIAKIDDHLSEYGDDGWTFASGVAHSARELQLIYCPQESSYRRLQDDLLKRNWLNFKKSISTETRDGLIRYVQRDGRYEFRLPDPTANIFSALSAVLASGFAGLANRRTLSDGLTSVVLNKSLTESEVAFRALAPAEFGWTVVEAHGLGGLLRTPPNELGT